MNFLVCFSFSKMVWDYARQTLEQSPNVRRMDKFSTVTIQGILTVIKDPLDLFTKKGNINYRL